MLYSPVFNVSPGSSGPPWRESVREVWNYIQANRSIGIDEYVGTSIHISMDPKFTLQEVRRIAQAGIFFEPAVEALIPQLEDGGLNYASNWVQSWDLAPSGRSRLDSIDFIEASASLDAVASLMQRNSPPGSFTWAFKQLTQPQERIEFHRSPPCHNADEAIRYPEFTMCFVRAAMGCSKEQMLGIPPNVGGLRWFLDRFRVLWLYNNCQQMPRIWRGVPFDAMSEPRRPDWTTEQQNFIRQRGLSDVEEMMREDLERCRQAARNAQTPYC